MTCIECHWDNLLNDSAGALKLSGVPASYTPGERYPITVAIAHPQLIRSGFQLSARFENGDNAGTLRAADDRTQTITSDDGRVVYLQHTRSGSMATSKAQAEWSVDWTAPNGGAVMFHAAGNAANGDASPLGDFIYTASAVATSAAAATKN